MDRIVSALRWACRLLPARNAGGSVVIRHLATGAFLGEGALLVDDAARAMVLSAEDASALVARWACEPDSFLVQAAPVLVGAAA
jgi:hypothetical protein